MRLRSCSLLLALLACIGLARGVAAWDDRLWGDPIMEIFRPRTTGHNNLLRGIVQDPRSGSIYVGAAPGLVTFDGAQWHHYSLGASVISCSLSLEPDSRRLWIGAYNDLGYCELEADQDPRFVSLKPQLPFAPESLDAVWGCHAQAGQVAFVSRDRVLRWDGSKFEIWQFPTKGRLFPIIFEGALWFHHFETGLYRLDAAGPTRIRETATLPDRGLFWLERAEGKLIGASNRGFQILDEQQQVLSPAELNQFMMENRVVGVADLPGGFRAIATLDGGVAITTREGKILRRIHQREGLANKTYGLLLDRDRDLWLLNTANLVRLASTGATAQVRFPGLPSEVSISSLTTENADKVWICANGEIFSAQPAQHRGESMRVERLPLSQPIFQHALPTPQGLLLSRFGGIDLWADGRLTSVAEFLAQNVTLMTPSSRDPNRYWVKKTQGVGELVWRPSAGWTFLNHDDTPSGAAEEDHDGNLWHTSSSLPPSISRRLPDDRLASPQPVFPAGDGAYTPNFVIPLPRGVLLIAGNKFYTAVAGQTPTALDFALPGQHIAAAASPDKSRIYVAFERAEAPAAFKIGLGSLEISADGRPSRWRDLIVPGLQTVDAIITLHVTRERDADTVWIGGSSGLIQVRPAELAEWRPPAPPTITLTAPRATGSALEFPSDARIELKLNVADIALRPALRLQTRFGQGEPPWSEISNRTSYEFSNLTEGTYTFAARTVNPAGQTSAPAYFTFTIRPPWYRSPWAYAGYTFLVAAAVFGAMSYRERRIRAHNLRLEQLVRQRTAELEKANAAKDEFLASMSHEIRNPMNGVVGLSAAIDITPLDDEGRHRFGLLRHCASHLASLLEDILDFSKLQSGTIELDPQPFSPAELIDAVAAILSPVTAAAGVKVEYALGPTVPPRLIGDARRIRQVLLNYVSNAVKYAPQGTIELTAWSRPLSLDRVALTFAVSDEGPGIPAEEQQRIFEKFERGASARSNRIPGTGMGLAVCRRLAEQMGGRAWVESTPGEGSTFYLSLDLPIARLATDRAPEIALAGLPKRALVVDDEEYNLIALSALLERRGFQVTRAGAATAALDHLRTHKPDLILLDYDMPDITGPALARRLREATPANQPQPLILAVTAYSTIEKRHECLVAGMDGFLGKPLTEEHLQAALDDALARRSPGSVPPPSAPAKESPAPLENLQVLARQHSRALAAELAEFAAGTTAEFDELERALADSHTVNAARAAHKLSGRFGFLHAAAPMKRALRLEETCRCADWKTARSLALELRQDWETLHASLARLTRDSAG